MEMILKTTNLCKSFSGQTVVNNISLNIERNSVYGLLGPNGAGKSTTLKMITGILKPTSGSIEFDGHTWKRSDLNHIGALSCLYLMNQLTGLTRLELKNLESLSVLFRLKVLRLSCPVTFFPKCSRQPTISALSPATAVYSVLQSIAGSIGIILASVWQIPLCLYLARKTGLFLPIVLNTVLGIFMPIALGNTVVWWLVPYCYAAKLADPLMGIELNGTFEGNCGFSITVLISIVLSILLFLILSYADAKDFSKRR